MNQLFQSLLLPKPNLAHFPHSAFWENETTLLFAHPTTVAYQLTYSRRCYIRDKAGFFSQQKLTAVLTEVMSSPCDDAYNNKILLACLAAYERLACGGIRIFALAFPYDAKGAGERGTSRQGS
ncbi:hypothetical protein [Hydrocoleum sp. CS-953]|uniref:hypothetical protein n=1 Tax=Hydrocoleum sp. CS-953 TaxID=1671698 RepID=UPI001AEF7314|nr:hypothetical protein [Hydrocoleum sp. CS-953]